MNVPERNPPMYGLRSFRHEATRVFNSLSEVLKKALENIYIVRRLLHSWVCYMCKCRIKLLVGSLTLLCLSLFKLYSYLHVCFIKFVFCFNVVYTIEIILILLIGFTCVQRYLYYIKYRLYAICTCFVFNVMFLVFTFLHMLLQKSLYHLCLYLYKVIVPCLSCS